MSYYEYRVVPAPRTLARVNRARTPEERYGGTLELALNAEGREGWEFQRIETVTVLVRRGWLSRGRDEAIPVMVFRRWVETGSDIGWLEDQEVAADGGPRGARGGGLRRETEPPLRSFQDRR